jgi:hypothetical protein
MPGTNAGFAAFLVNFQIIRHSPTMWQITENHGIRRMLKQKIFHIQLRGLGRCLLLMLSQTLAGDVTRSLNF